VVLGLGTGRSASTTLAAMLSTLPGSCVTHENPPLIFWNSKSEQVSFHIERLELLSKYFASVGDVAHWWINVVDAVIDRIPRLKIVGSIREVDECAKSFMRIKGYGPKSTNHWVKYGIGPWPSHPWDPTYPSYDTPHLTKRNIDQVKYELICRYIREYNERLQTLACRSPHQVKLVSTWQLNDFGVQDQIFRFLGSRGPSVAIKLNVHSVADGTKDEFRF
jgi:hypothetical protein